MGTFEYDNLVTLEDLETFNVNTTEKPRWPIWRREGINQVDLEKDEEGPFMPTWQTSPVIRGGLEVNENILADTDSSSGARLSFSTGSVVVGNFFMLPPDDPRMSTLLSAIEQEEVAYDGSPVSQVYFPIFDSFDEDRKVVAVMVAWIHWLSYFQDTFPGGASGIQVVLHNECEESGNTAFTFEIDGAAVIPMGEGDLHDKSFESMIRGASMKSISNIADGTHEGLHFNTDYCEVYISVYASDKFHAMFRTNEPVTMTVAVAVVLFVAVLMFFVYDR